MITANNCWPTVFNNIILYKYYQHVVRPLGCHYCCVLQGGPKTSIVGCHGYVVEGYLIPHIAQRVLHVTSMPGRTTNVLVCAHSCDCWRLENCSETPGNLDIILIKREIARLTSLVSRKFRMKIKALFLVDL